MYAHVICTCCRIACMPPAVSTKQSMLSHMQKACAGPDSAQHEVVHTAYTLSNFRFRHESGDQQASNSSLPMLFQSVKRYALAQRTILNLLQTIGCSSTTYMGLLSLSSMRFERMDKTTGSPPILFQPLRISGPNFLNWLIQYIFGQELGHEAGDQA